jgi:hypothetical protein
VAATSAHLTNPKPTEIDERQRGPELTRIVAEQIDSTTAESPVCSQTPTLHLAASAKRTAVSVPGSDAELSRARARFGAPASDEQ